MQRRVTIRDIATEVGVHYSTVSRALRGMRRVDPELIARIRAAADRLGYVADPLLFALCRYRATLTPKEGDAHLSQQGTLAFVFPMPFNDLTPGGRAMFLAARTRAERLGFSLGFFENANTPQSAKQLDRVLAHRGVQGIILAPLVEAGAMVDLTWTRYAIVAVGFTIVQPSFDQVVPHQAQMMRLQLEKLRELGYRRIGLVLTPNDSLRTRQSHLSAFLCFQFELPAKDRVNPLVEEEPNTVTIKNWIRSERLHCIISSKEPVRVLIEKAGYPIPSKIGFSLIGYRPKFPEIAGVDERWASIGEEAADAVVAKIARGEFGVSKSPRILLVPCGSWRPARTVKARSTRSGSTPAASHKRTMS